MKLTENELKAVEKSEIAIRCYYDEAEAAEIQSAEKMGCLGCDGTCYGNCAIMCGGTCDCGYSGDDCLKCGGKRCHYSENHS